MANITITNNDLGSCALEVVAKQSAILRNAALTTQVFAEGTLLARHATDGKLYPYDPADTTEDLDKPKYVLTYEVTALTASDNAVEVMTTGKVNQRRLVIHDGTPVAAEHIHALLDSQITPIDVAQMAKIDNPQS